MGWRGRGAVRESGHLMDDATRQNLGEKMSNDPHFWRRVEVVVRVKKRTHKHRYSNV